MAALILLPGSLFAGPGADPSWLMPNLAEKSGAYAVAMGGAYSAVAEGLPALAWNAAGLSLLREPEIMFSYRSLKVDGSWQHVIGGFPVADSGALAVGASYVEFGEFERRDAFGALQPNSFSAYSLGLEMAYGRAMTERLSAGIAYKFWRQHVDYDSLGAHALSLGTRLQLPRNFVLALTGSNLGPKIDSYKLPSDFTLGAAKAANLNPHIQVLLAADLTVALNGDLNVNGGLQSALYRNLFLRFGYQGHSGDELGSGRGWSGGLGVHYGTMTVDYALASFGDLGQKHIVSLGVQVPASKGGGSRPPQPLGVTRPTVSARELFAKALRAHQEKNYPLAIAGYESGLRLEPKNSGAWRAVGVSFLRNKQVEKAVVAFETFLSIRPDDKQIQELLKKCRSILKARTGETAP